MARVTVVIPAYNAEATIASTLESVFEQTFRDFEVICVDDGSTDRTKSIVRGFADRVRILEQSNSGPSAARNLGAARSSGDYLAFLDADDLWVPRMLERMVAAFDSDPATSLIFCDAAICDSEGRALGTSIVGKGYDHPPSLDELLTRLWPIMPSAALVRRSLYEKAGGFWDELRGASYRFEDIDFYIRMREQGPFAYIPEQLVTWRFAWFPKPLKKLPDYSQAIHKFEPYLQQHYGVSARPLVDARRRAPRSILANIGLTALREGDRRRARAAFARALRVGPFRLRNCLRWLRTFLPHRIAMGLTGAGTRTARGSTRA